MLFPFQPDLVVNSKAQIQKRAGDNIGIYFIFIQRKLEKKVQYILKLNYVYWSKDMFTWHVRSKTVCPASEKLIRENKGIM